LGERKIYTARKTTRTAPPKVIGIKKRGGISEKKGKGKRRNGWGARGWFGHPNILGKKLGGKGGVGGKRRWPSQEGGGGGSGSEGRSELPTIKKQTN